MIFNLTNFTEGNDPTGIHYNKHKTQYTPFRRKALSFAKRLEQADVMYKCESLFHVKLLITHVMFILIMYNIMDNTIA